MRLLAPSPARFLDAATGAPAFGAYSGPLPRIELPSLGLRDRIARRKKWFWFAVTTDEVWISCAIVRTGYAASAFAFAFDLREKRMLVDRTVLGPTVAGTIADGPHENGSPIARFKVGRSKIAVIRERELRIAAELDGLSFAASIDEASAPPSVAAIAKLAGGDGLLDATEKVALAPVRGEAKVGGRAFDLAKGMAGWDYTHGLMPRHTRWNWAFGLGRATDGAPLAFNVVNGFVGEAECAMFRDGKVEPIAEPRFVIGDDTWRLEGEGIDLTFDVGAVHRQHTNLVVVKSRFVQPVGTFRGKIGGVEIDGLPGVVEDQDVLW